VVVDWIGGGLDVDVIEIVVGGESGQQLTPDGIMLVNG
jgi:hypothetical protein